MFAVLTAAVIHSTRTSNLSIHVITYYINLQALFI